MENSLISSAWMHALPLTLKKYVCPLCSTSQWHVWQCDLYQYNVTKYYTDTHLVLHIRNDLLCALYLKNFKEGELKASCNCICLEPLSLYKTPPPLFVYDSYSIQSSELYIERKSVKYKYGDHLQCRVFVFGQNLL